MGGGRADTRYFLLHIVCRERSGREADTVPQGFEAQSCFDTENVSAIQLEVLESCSTKAKEICSIIS